METNCRNCGAGYTQATLGRKKCDYCGTIVLADGTILTMKTKSTKQTEKLTNKQWMYALVGLAVGMVVYKHLKKRM